MTLSLLLSLASPASAFCGTYVSSYDEAPQNAASEVAIVRQGQITTLTVANDVQGDIRDFAMVIPVPEVLAEDQIHVVDPTVFDRLRAYSDPREVSYTCEDFAPRGGDTAGMFDSSDTSWADTASPVEIEAQYIVGEYDIVILSATESGALIDWLQVNGYQVPDASAELLSEYIAGGAFFFAAQVREDAGLEPGQLLSPLQFSYHAETFGLPIRIGTLNSPGEQDLRIYAFTDYDQGAVGISNYSEQQVDHDCMWQPDGAETFSAYYDRQLDTAFGNVAGAEWVTEYSWGNGNCDPCTGVIPSPDDVYTLGYQDDYHYGQYYWFTRIRMRYSPTTATQDLVLYETRRNETTQMRFIQYDHQLEEHFPICNVGTPDVPGTCDADADDILAADGGCGCSSSGGTGTFAGLSLLGLALTRRRRS